MILTTMTRIAQQASSPSSLPISPPSSVAIAVLTVALAAQCLLLLLPQPVLNSHVSSDVLIASSCRVLATAVDGWSENLFALAPV
jgi:hypothetical protein